MADLNQIYTKIEALADDIALAEHPDVALALEGVLEQVAVEMDRRDALAQEHT